MSIPAEINAVLTPISLLIAIELYWLGDFRRALEAFLNEGDPPAEQRVATKRRVQSYLKTHLLRFAALSLFNMVIAASLAGYVRLVTIRLYWTNPTFRIFLLTYGAICLLLAYSLSEVVRILRGWWIIVARRAHDNSAD